MRLPVKVTCAKHGDTIRYNKNTNTWDCIDKHEGSYCASLRITKRRNGLN